MSILFTGDFQADFSNLDLCDDAWSEIISISNKNDVDTIVLLGDLTQAYNPVDARVMVWWQNKIRDAIRRGLKVIIQKGNHDRVGQFAESGDKLPIYKRAGAITFPSPGPYMTEIGTLYILPYMGVNETRVGARKMARNADKSRDILCFHQDVRGTYYNRFGSESDAKLTAKDLFHDRFRYCIGGHIHFPQRFRGNCYYVGSPFCQDWGEVNQQKRYLIVSKTNIKSVGSSIPRWYDPDVNGFAECIPNSWKSSRIRISVPCDASQDYGRRMDKARKSAEHKYRGAEIYVVPKFRDHVESRQVFRTTDSDERKIKEYIRLSNHRLEGEERVLKYMVGLLNQVNQKARQQLSINFESIRAENFLSYKKLYLNLREKGLVLIQGKNSDRSGKSNGAGKTSLVQPIPVALFGRTFKDQKHDSWANRFVASEPAEVKVKFINANNQEVVVTRGRRPPLLKMEVNGKDISSGMKSNDRDGTQGQIESYTGFTAQTLANSLYIDRTISDGFLSGTKRSRTELLNKFQNLERFTKALELVRRDIKGNLFNQGRVREDLAGNKSAIKHKKEEIVSIEKVSHDQLVKAKKDYKKAESSERNYIAAKNSRRKRLRRQIHLYESVSGRGLEAKRASLGERITIITRDIQRSVTKEIKAGTCPTCNQEVSKAWCKKHEKENNRERRQWSRTLEDLRDKFKKIDNTIITNEAYLEAAEEELHELKSRADNLHAAAETLRKQYIGLDKAASRSNISRRARRDYKELKRKRKELKQTLQSYKGENRMQEFVAEAFSRDGIPAFLNRALCPVLNKAADYYAELFSDREIQLQFLVEEGEFVPKVINAKGGEDIESQSAGERALAGLIASFSLRDVGPKSNLLVLDEPGEGLDASTAKQFARALHKLKKRFGLIIVCTHNVHIASELNPDKTITVVKKNGISKIKEN